MRRPSKLVVLLALVSALALVSSVIAVGAVAQDTNREGPIEQPTASDPGSFSVQYSVKYICGFLPPVPPDLDQWAKPGDYYTSINVHNHTNINTTVGKRVALSYRMGGAVPPLQPSFGTTAFRYRTLTIDCVDIWAMVGVPPGSFIEGNVHIGLTQPLPVQAVYTSQTHADPNAGADPGAGHSIDVEQIVPIQAPIG